MPFIKYAMMSAMICSMNVFAASWQITYPKPAELNKESSIYPLALLSVALDQTGVNYELKPSDRHLSQSKILDRLKDNREVNISWSMTDEQREKDLLPIRIPIYKGLIGWRLLMIREDMSERFSYIQKLEHLVKLIPIQGHDWPDTKILQSNGFDVVTGLQHNDMFNMVVNAEGDFYPRSIVEIWSELKGKKPANKLIVQPSLGIRYPAAVYFFVNKKSVPLANLLRTGLEKAIKNGKFDELFWKTHRPYIEQANIQSRDFYHLENTFLPAETPLNRLELWFQGTEQER